MYASCLVCWCSGLVVIFSPNEAWVHLLPLEVGGAKRAGRRGLWPSFLSYPSNFLSSWQQVQHSPSHWSPVCIIAPQSEVTKTNLSIGIDWPWQKGKWTLNWGGLGENDTDSAACGRFLEEKRGGDKRCPKHCFLLWGYRTEWKKELIIWKDVPSPMLSEAKDFWYSIEILLEGKLSSHALMVSPSQSSDQNTTLEISFLEEMTHRVIYS